MFVTPLRRGQQPDDTQELRRDRARNDRRLKTTFERIFDKYNKDFSQLGDEIDLVTGRVVKDNGHLVGMQHERDTGSSASKRFVRAFTHELGGEDHIESRAQRHMSEVYRGLLAEDSSELDTEEVLHPSPAAGPDNQAHTVGPGTSRHQTTAALVSVSQQSPPTARSIDPDAIQSLGNALASQIAVFLNQQLSGQSLAAQAQQLTTQILPVQQNDKWMFPALTPQRGAQHDDHAGHPSSPSPSLRSFSPMGDVSLWATGKAADRVDEHPAKRRRLLDGYQVHEVWPSIEDGDNLSASEAEQTPELEFMHEYQDESSLVDVPDALETFGQTAKYNFQLLAHGLANRGHMVASEVAPVLRRSNQVVSMSNRTIVRDPTRSATWGLKRFTRQEDATIVRLKKKLNLPWSQIAAHFPDRSEASLQVRWNRSLKEGAARFRRGYVVDLDDQADLEQDSHLPDAGDSTQIPTMAHVSDVEIGTAQPTAARSPLWTNSVQCDRKQTHEVAPSHGAGTSRWDLAFGHSEIRYLRNCNSMRTLPAADGSLHGQAREAVTPQSAPSTFNQGHAGSDTHSRATRHRDNQKSSAHTARVPREPALYDNLVEEREVWYPPARASRIEPGRSLAGKPLQNKYAYPGLPRASDWNLLRGHAGSGGTTGHAETDAESMRDEQTPAPIISGSEFVAYDPTGPVIPRRRGRPRKASAERKKKGRQSQAGPHRTFIHVRPTDAQNTHPFIKRRRGRPPKRQPAVMDFVEQTPQSETVRVVTDDTDSPPRALRPARSDRVIVSSTSPEPVPIPVAESVSDPHGVRHLTPDTSISSGDQHTGETLSYGFALDPALATIGNDNHRSVPVPHGMVVPMAGPRLTTPPRKDVEYRYAEPQYPSPPDRNTTSTDRGRASANAESLRSSVLRKAFATPHKHRGSSAASMRSGSSYQSGPVPMEDASDDDL